MKEMFRDEKRDGEIIRGKREMGKWSKQKGNGENMKLMAKFVQKGKCVLINQS